MNSACQMWITHSRLKPHILPMVFAVCRYVVNGDAKHEIVMALRLYAPPQVLTFNRDESEKIRS